MKFLGFTVFFFIFFSHQVQALKILLQPRYDEFRASYKKLTKEEILTLNKFKESVKADTGDDIPPEILKDIMTCKAIGFREFNLRTMSDDEKAFIKKHIDKIPMLDFLLSLNLNDLGLATLPDELANITTLFRISVMHNKLKSTPKAIEKLLGKITFPTDIKWSRELIDTIGKNDTAPTNEIMVQDFFFAIIEIALKCANTKTGINQQINWLKRHEKRKYLQSTLSRVSPAILAEFAATFPFGKFEERLQKKFRTMALPLITYLVNFLNYAQKITMIHTRKSPDAPVLLTETFGSESYLQGNLVDGYDKLWPTAQGFLCIFETLGLTEDSNEVKLSPEEREAFVSFKNSVQGDIPWIIKEDILVHKAIGVRDNLPRDFNAKEKAWLKANIFSIPRLTFINAVNLIGMELDKLPKNFNEMSNLKEIHLDDNKFTDVPDIAFYLSDDLKIYISDNQMNRDAIAVFQEKFDKFLSKERRTECVKSKLNFKKLKWTNALLTRSGCEKLFPYEPALTKKAEISAALKELDRVFARGDFDLAKKLADKTNAYELYADNDERTIYYGWFFLRLIQRLSEENNAKKSHTVDDFSILNDVNTLPEDLNDLPYNVWLEAMLPELRGFLHCYTPYEFIKMASNKEKLCLAITTKELMQHSRHAFGVLIVNLVKTNQIGVVSHMLRRSSATQKPSMIKKYVGWEDYLTEAPKFMSASESPDGTETPSNLTFGGWFKELGLAELMLHLGLVEVDEGL